MTNRKLIDKAVQIVIDYFETEGITESTTTIRKRATDWYNGTDIASAQKLAAVVISGDYEADISADEINMIEEFFFPSAPLEYDHFHISEIEQAQKDIDLLFEGGKEWDW